MAMISGTSFGVWLSGIELGLFEGSLITISLSVNVIPLFYHDD